MVSFRACDFCSRYLFNVKLWREVLVFERAEYMCDPCADRYEDMSTRYDEILGKYFDEMS